MIKHFFKKTLDFLDSVSRARAASEFVRMGHYDLARNIMLKDDARNS